MYCDDIDVLIDKVKEQMNNSIKVFREKLSTIRNSRVHINMLNNVKVNSYGEFLKIDQVASLTLLDAQTMVVKPWDKALIKHVESAISKADLGVTITKDSEGVLLKVLPMTQEIREKSVSQVKAEVENAKIYIRKIRQEAKDNLKKLSKEDAFPEDEIKKADALLQKLTDNSNKEIETIGDAKKKDLMKI